MKSVKTLVLLVSALMLISFSVSVFAVVTCGNGIAEEGEACDSGNKNGQRGYCNVDCSGQGSPTCGNGIKEFGEECDDGSKNGELGYCNELCTGITGNNCGNGAQEIYAGEACEGWSWECSRFGFSGGMATCSSNCLYYDLSGCTNETVCGNGIIEAGEDCDTAELAGKTCQSFGYVAGNLVCGEGGRGCQGFDKRHCRRAGDDIVDFHFEPVSSSQPIVNQPFAIDLVFKSHPQGKADSSFSVAQIVFQWDQTKTFLHQELDLSRSEFEWMFAGFPRSRFGNHINDDLDDRDAEIGFIPQLGATFPVAPRDGIVIATLWVTPLVPGEFTIDVPWIADDYPASNTAIGSGIFPGLNIAGDLYSITLVAQEGSAGEFCGNGVKDLGEECDGLDLGDSRCPNFGSPPFDGGIITCNSDCTYNTGQCVYGDSTYSEALCGDTFIDYAYGLVCETGSDPNNSNDDMLGQIAPPDFGCNVFGFEGGALQCGDDCSYFDTSLCVGGSASPVCGNNVKENGEVCDGIDLAGQTCQTQGFDQGSLSCLPSCSGFDTTSCSFAEPQPPQKPTPPPPTPPVQEKNIIEVIIDWLLSLFGA